MNIGTDIAYYAGAGILSAGVVVGTVKARMKNFLTKDQHAKLCAMEREESRKEFQSVKDELVKTGKLVAEMHGFMKGRNGGML